MYTLGNSRATVDGRNLATPEAPGAQHVMEIFAFGGVEGSRGPGAITNRRGMRKHIRGLIFVRVGCI